MVFKAFAKGNSEIISDLSLYFRKWRKSLYLGRTPLCATMSNWCQSCENVTKKNIYRKSEIFDNFRKTNGLTYDFCSGSHINETCKCEKIS